MAIVPHNSMKYGSPNLRFLWLIRTEVKQTEEEEENFDQTFLPRDVSLARVSGEDKKKKKKKKNPEKSVKG